MDLAKLKSIRYALNRAKKAIDTEILDLLDGEDDASEEDEEEETPKSRRKPKPEAAPKKEKKEEKPDADDGELI